VGTIQYRRLANPTLQNALKEKAFEAYRDSAKSIESDPIDLDPIDLSY
jgi:hypothetical protein